MRTIKQLLELMLDNQQCFKAGLCSWTLNLYYYGIISSKECKRLYNFIDNNRKTPILSIQDIWYKRGRGYYWNPNKIKPRIDWIKYQINQCQNLTN